MPAATPRAQSRSRSRAGFRPRRLLALIGAAALAAAGLSLGLTAPANAAVISGAITNVTVSPVTPEQGSQLTTRIDWRVPDATKQGDTFTLTLSTHLKNLPLGFALRDPDTQAIVANAAISDTDPAVITFTMTAYAESHLATHGSAFITSDFDARTTPSGQPTAITSTTNDGRTFSTTITPHGTVGDSSAPDKYGDFTRPDAGRTNGADFLAYTVVTPEGPLASSSIVDSVPAGQHWTFDCSSLQVLDGTFGTDGFVDSYSPTDPISRSCTATQISVQFGAAAAGHLFSIQYSVSLPGGAGTGADAPAQTFLNSAEVDWTPSGVGAAPQNATVFASNIQSSDGGTGVGVARVPSISITKGDSNGNAADTEATAATLPSNGSATLEYVVTNTGSDELTGVRVSDSVLANGTVTGLTCDFSGLGGPSTGTTFSGRVPVGASFPCTASLTGVTATGGDHHDVGTVTATGVISGTPVTASNAYWAKVVTVSTSSDGELAYTGSNTAGPLGVAGGLLALGATLLTVAAIRRRRAEVESD